MIVLSSRLTRLSALSTKDSSFHMTLPFPTCSQYVPICSPCVGRQLRGPLAQKGEHLPGQPSLNSNGPHGHVLPFFFYIIFRHLYVFLKFGAVAALICSSCKSQNQTPSGFVYVEFCCDVKQCSEK